METIYFIITKPFLNLAKIGKTGNIVRNRKDNLQTAHYNELIIYKKIDAPITLRLEKILHRLLERVNERGEWFRLTLTEMDNIYNETIDFVKYYMKTMEKFFTIDLENKRIDEKDNLIDISIIDEIETNDIEENTILINIIENDSDNNSDNDTNKDDTNKDDTNDNNDNNDINRIINVNISININKEVDSNDNNKINEEIEKEENNEEIEKEQNNKEDNNQKKNNAGDNKHVCPNCFKGFIFKYLLDRHMYSTRTCHKAKIVNGEIISDKSAKCEVCNSTFQNKYTLARHKKNNCRTKKSKLNKVVNEKVINESIIEKEELENNNLVLNTNILYKYIEPLYDFEVIKDDVINYKSIKEYFNKLNYKSNNCIFNNVADIIINILYNIYIKDIPVLNRNIVSINKASHIYYYINKKWYFDVNRLFHDECVKKLINQFIKVVNYNKNIINSLLNGKLDTLNMNVYRHLELNEELNNSKIQLNKVKLNDRIKFYDRFAKQLLMPGMAKHITYILKSKLNINKSLQEM